jgi:hypothetical protein
MIDPRSIPAPTSPAEHHADFLELCAFRSAKGSISFQEFMRDLRMASATETLLDSELLNDDDDGDERSEGLAEAAFAELDDRRRSCGGETSSYPFEFEGDSLSLGPSPDESLYTFLALLSWFGKDAGPEDTDGEKLFEEICAKIAEAYLGGPGQRVRSYVFGFPRRLKPPGFAGALDELCNQLGEGNGHHKGRPKLPDQKDGKLDIVAWVEFADGRQGKLITFGQCATGRNWDEKVVELPPPDRWCTHWMAESPSVVPIRSFFVPHRVEQRNWSHTCTFGGILYDRCRIASLGSTLDADLRRQWMRWSSHVLEKIREMQP